MKGGQIGVLQQLMVLVDSELFRMYMCRQRRHSFYHVPLLLLCPGCVVEHSLKNNSKNAAVFSALHCFVPECGLLTFSHTCCLDHFLLEETRAKSPHSPLQCRSMPLFFVSSSWSLCFFCNLLFYSSFVWFFTTVIACVLDELLFSASWHRLVDNQHSTKWLVERKKMHKQPPKGHLFGKRCLYLQSMPPHKRSTQYCLADRAFCAVLQRECSMPSCRGSTRCRMEAVADRSGSSLQTLFLLHCDTL